MRSFPSKREGTDHPPPNRGVIIDIAVETSGLSLFCLGINLFCFNFCVSPVCCLETRAVSLQLAIILFTRLSVRCTCIWVARHIVSLFVGNVGQPLAFEGHW
jgi:hypothetical protein